MSLKTKFEERISETFAIPKSDVSIIYDILIECMRETIVREEKIVLDSLFTVRIKRKDHSATNFDFRAAEALRRYIRDNPWEKLKKLDHPELYEDND